MSLMRVLMTNACSFNCHYCPMRRDRNLPRTLLKPEELVRIFLEAHRRRWCRGLFVTTGIPGRPVKVMDDLIAALELLRVTHAFRGYIHVKMVPGGEPAQIYSTIVEGRPNGMPSFGGRIPDYEVWRLVAYVRSLSGNVEQIAAPGRPDNMYVREQQQSSERQPPVDSAGAAR